MLRGRDVKVNLIGNLNELRTIKDMNIFEEAWKSTRNIHKINIQSNRISINNYSCNLSHINVFFGNLNPTLFLYANHNIFIPNHNSIEKNILKEYLKKSNNNFLFDIWTKNEYSNEILNNIFISSNQNVNLQNSNIIQNIGWSSSYNDIDNYRKNKEALILVPDDTDDMLKHKNLQFIIYEWKAEYPQLNIYIRKRLKDNIDLKTNLSNIKIYHSDFSEDDIYNIQKQSWYHICCFDSSTFSHTINEARKVGSVVIIPNNNNKSFSWFKIDNKVDTRVILKSKKNRYLGNHTEPIVEEFRTTLEQIFNYDTNTLLNIGKKNRREYEKDRVDFFNNIGLAIKNIFTGSVKQKRKAKVNIFSNNPPSMLKFVKPNKNDTPDLPIINIITVTKNREIIFPLAINCVNKFDYPRDKLRWIIIEDGDECVKPLLDKYCSLKPDQIIYKKTNNSVTIGQKRNLGIGFVNNENEYIMMMDDDDYYKPNYIRSHLELFNLYPERECHYCSTIGVFHLTKMYSMINMPPLNITPEKRLSEATLFFKKSFASRRMFSNNQIAEGELFIKSRINETLEVPWEPIFVSFLHSRTTSSRDTYKGEPNGCHYGLDNNFFLFVTKIGEEMEKIDKEEKN
jgi:hypothetical protein